MDESQVVADFLFPTDKKTPRTVRPGVAAFDYPATGALPGTTFGLNLALAGNVQRCNRKRRARVSVGWPQYPLSRHRCCLRPSDRLGTRHGNRSQRGPQQSERRERWPGDGNAQRHAAAVGHDRSLDAQLTAIGGVFAGFFPRPTAPWSWSRPRLPTPADSASRVIDLQTLLPEAMEDASSAPFLEVSMHRARRTELRRQRLPLAARPQQIEDAVGNASQIHPRPPALPTAPIPGQQRLEPPPHFLRHLRKPTTPIATAYPPPCKELSDFHVLFYARGGLLFSFGIGP